MAEKKFLELTANVHLVPGGRMLKKGYRGEFDADAAGDLLSKKLAVLAVPDEAAMVDSDQGAELTAPEEDAANPAGDTTTAPAGLPEPSKDKVLVVIPNAADRKGLKCLDPSVGLCETTPKTAQKKINDGVGIAPENAGMVGE